MEIQEKVIELLEEAGIGTDPASILAAGQEGLTAVKGIGPATAGELLKAAEAAQQEAPAPAPAPEEDNEVKVKVEAEAEAQVEEQDPTDEQEPDESPAPAPTPTSTEDGEVEAEARVEEQDPTGEQEPEPAPIPPGTKVRVRLVGISSAVVDGTILYEGNSRVVSYAAYQAAAAEHAPGQVQFGLPGGDWQ